MSAKILVVDDDPIFAEMMQFVLRQAGFESHPAASGEQALEALRTVAVDLVILDVMLPDMDGFEICKRIRSLPGSEDKPILMLSARTMVEDKLSGFGAGADDYLAKPADPKEIVARAKALLARAERSRSHTGRVIALVGAKGGAGATTTAVHLGLGLAALKRRALLVEQSAQAPLGAWMLNLRPTRSLAELASGGSLTRSALNAAIVRHSSGLGYLANSLGTLAPAAAGGKLTEALEILQRDFDDILVDVDLALPAGRETLRQSPHIVVVVEHSAPAVHQAKGVLAWLNEEGIDSQLVGIVLVQKSAAPTRESASAIASELGVGVLQVIPPAPDTLFHASGRQESLFEADGEHPAAQAFSELAQRVAEEVISAPAFLQP